MRGALAAKVRKARIVCSSGDGLMPVKNRRETTSGQIPLVGISYDLQLFGVVCTISRAARAARIKVRN